MKMILYSVPGLLSAAVCTCERAHVNVVVKICMVPADLGVFTPLPVPVCIGTVTVVTLVGFTQIA